VTIVKVSLNKYLYALLGRQELVDTWWESPNRAFEGRTPNEVYWSGEDGRKQVAKYIIDNVNPGYS
jgi:hypothetical protein